jgi:predicted dehydrogenase
MSRRRLLGSSLSAVGGALLLTRARTSGQVLGANNRIRIAIAGLNGRGESHLGEFLAMPDVEVAYLIDPDSRVLSRRARQAQEKSGKRPEVLPDVRDALDRKDVDVLSIAAPNHWHALMTIWACQAGKDVYVEKPMSHNIREGRMAVETARKYQRIVQHGTQARSKGGWENVVEVIRSGQLGKLLVSRGLCYKRRGSIGVKPPQQPPKELDFNLWLGPAREQPYHENLVHYNWHWFWDTGNGDIGNQGVHEMDKARWAIPGATLPRSVISLGGRFGYEDQGQTANTQMAVFDYGESLLIFEVRGLETEEYHGVSVGNICHLEGGTIAEGRFFPTGSKEPKPLPKVESRRGPGKNNFHNFMAAVRSRKQSDLNADILEGHYSSALCHLANASYRLGKEVPFQSADTSLADAAGETLARMEEHLGAGNNLNLREISCRLGRKLTIDPKTEMAVGDEAANKILAGGYRDGFSLPVV